jgi:predicted nucleic acid-binding protein
MKVHLDTDFLVYALAVGGPERRRLTHLARTGATFRMSAVAWYEFARGPRTPEQLAVARTLFSDDGIVPFSEDLADCAAEVFRRLGSPRKRAADIAIGVTAAADTAILLSRNARDFADIPDLDVEGVSGAK